jgi:hypothetical protein
MYPIIIVLFLRCFLSRTGESRLNSNVREKFIMGDVATSWQRVFYLGLYPTATEGYYKCDEGLAQDMRA